MNKNKPNQQSFGCEIKNSYISLFKISDFSNVLFPFLNKLFAMSEDIAEGVDTGEYTETVRALSSGLLQMYEPTLNQVKSNLKELLEKQEEMQIALANEKLAYNTQEVQQISEMVNKAKIYREKAVRIKNQMHQIHQRAKSLRAKALDIQELKVNQCASKLQQLHYEESLVANIKKGNRKS